MAQFQLKIVFVGMGADLFESYVGSIIATATLGDGLRGLTGYGIGVNDYQGLKNSKNFHFLKKLFFAQIQFLLLFSCCITVFGCWRWYFGVYHRWFGCSHQRSKIDSHFFKKNDSNLYYIFKKGC